MNIITTRSTSIETWLNNKVDNSPRLEIIASGEDNQIPTETFEETESFFNTLFHKETDSIISTNLEAVLDQNRTITHLNIDNSSFDSLIGISVYGGYRKTLAQTFKDSRSFGSLKFQLLDDLSTGATIASYLHFRTISESEGTISQDIKSAFVDKLTDSCAGWIDNGSAIKTVKLGKPIPVKVGPAVKGNFLGNNVVLSPLKFQAMRRRRYIIINSEDHIPQTIYCGFRDTMGELTGEEKVLHEYHLSIKVNTSTLLIENATATSKWLPFNECKSAETSVNALIGSGFDSISETVKLKLNNSTGCLHLNDLLRSADHFIQYITE